MRHYRFKLLFLFLAMLCFSGHAFGQIQWIDVGPPCDTGFYFGYFQSLGCSDYGDSIYGYYPVSAYAYWSSPFYAVYAQASANTYSGGGVYDDYAVAQSELAYNGTNPGFDEGYDEWVDAWGNGYSEGGGWVLYGYTGQ